MTDCGQGTRLIDRGVPDRVPTVPVTRERRSLSLPSLEGRARLRVAGTAGSVGRVQLVAQCADAHSKEFGGPGTIVLRDLERLCDERVFRLRDVQ